MKNRPGTAFLKAGGVGAIFGLAILFAALVMPALSAMGGVYYWDSDGTGASGNPPTAGVGGTGNWNNGANWWNGTSYTTWPNTNPNSDTSDFRVAAGTVTIDPGTTIYVYRLQLGVTGFKFQGGDANSVLSFSGANPIVSAANHTTIFSNLTINTGTGVVFGTAGGSHTFTNGLVLTGSGLIKVPNNVNYGNTLNLGCAQPAFEGGFYAYNFTLYRNAAIQALVPDSLGRGASTVEGGALIGYRWGAQTAVGNAPVGVTATGGGVIDLTGTYGNTKDRFILNPGGVLRGSNTQLTNVTRVSSFSASPTRPEAIMGKGAVVASTANNINFPAAVQPYMNLGTNADLYFGLGVDFTSASFALTVGANSPWKGICNDTQIGGDVSQRRLSAGTVTVDTSAGLSEFQFLTQGVISGIPLTYLWSKGYQELIVGNNATMPTFALAGGSSAIPARIMPGSSVYLDGATFAPAAFSKYAVSYSAALVTTRSSALNGKDVDLEGGVLGVWPSRLGSPAGVNDSIGTLTVSGLSRILVNNKTVGTPDILTITNLIRSGRAVLEIANCKGNNAADVLGGDERVKVLSSVTRGSANVVDPYILAVQNGDYGLDRGDFLTYGANGFAVAPNTTSWGNGNVVSNSAVIGVSGTVSADGLLLGYNITNIGTGCTIKLGVLPDGSQAARAGLIKTVNTASIAPAIDAGTSELVVYSTINGTYSTWFYLTGPVTANGLTKTGVHPLHLRSATNNISGLVSIWNGSVVVDSNGNGLNDTASVYVGPLGTFNVSAPTNSLESVADLAGLGTVSIAAGKTNRVTGVLTAGNTERSLTVTTGGTLALGAGATAAFDLDYLNTPTGTPRLVMSSTALQIGSGARVKINSLTNTPAGVFARTFVLARYGSKTGVFASTVDAPEGVGGALVYDDANKLILLEVSPRVENGTLIMIR